MTLTPLYRPEVLAAKHNRWLGPLILRQPLSHWVLTFAACLLTLAVLALVVFGDYARKTRLGGRLVSSTPLLRVEAPRAGHVVALHADAGADVVPGAELGQVCGGEASACAPVRTPGSGHIAVQLANPGDAVAAGDALALVRPPHAVVQAELDLPARDIATLRPGLDVQVRYPAYPYQEYGQYTGRVTSISASPKRAADASANAQPVYRVLVALDRQSVRDARGTEHALFPGLPVESDVVVERRKLYQWLLRPLLRD